MSTDCLLSSAKSALIDVRSLRNKLELEVDDTEWRLQWVACVVLLRVIGHVLYKVDAGRSNFIKTSAELHFQKWKDGDEHVIFREFIDKERNSILKEYTTNMSEGPLPVVVQIERFGDDADSEMHGYLMQENIYRPMSDGFYEGEDGRTLIDEAIVWWEKQLKDIEMHAVTLSQR